MCRYDLRKEAGVYPVEQGPIPNGNDEEDNEDGFGWINMFGDNDRQRIADVSRVQEMFPHLTRELIASEVCAVIEFL